MTDHPICGVVAIGRNEGQRLIRCFDSIGTEYPVVYVDSGSSDGSVEEARRRGLRVVDLDTAQGFTAARARNAGWRDLLSAWPDLTYVQFVDGDCEFAPGWIATAMAAIEAEPGLCAVFGRRRERFPDASLYNALCDDEWNVPIGLREACGGDVLFRVAALKAVGGYNDDLIAGEEPDLCLRLGQEGWTIRRIDAEMTLHDAAIMRADQQWRRARRAGHAFAEHCARHGARAFASWRKQCHSNLLWAVVLPLLALVLLVAGLVSGWWLPLVGALLVAGIYPLQFARMTVRARRAGVPLRFAVFQAWWLLIGKFAQTGGMLLYWRNRLRRRRNQLIEYKS
jgi:glycosyltransferase involved in cell wall biosynthesis